MQRLFFTLAITILLIGCSKVEENTGSTSNGTSEGVTIPASLFTTERTDVSMNLLEAKNSAKVGDSVSFLARVGGRVKPFASGFAMFVVADPSLVSCELKGVMDHCPNPQDYCCEPPEKLKMGLATIQFNDEKGVPLRTTAEESGGLESSKFLIVEGTVLEKNDEGLFTVVADQIWVGGKPNRENPLQGSGLASASPVTSKPDHVPHDHDGDGIPDH